VRPEQVVVIGDTPRDIACARAGGVRVIAVATGRYSAADLAAHQPDVLLESLADTDRAVAAILEP
jgi:phosphoglycolate phosphatase-like HAD superfamily hydrolase